MDSQSALLFKRTDTFNKRTLSAVGIFNLTLLLLILSFPQSVQRVYRRQTMQICPPVLICETTKHILIKLDIRMVL